MGAISLVFHKTIPLVLGQRPGIDTGTTESDGYQQAPKSSSQEKPGTVYGEEDALIANQYFGYLLKLSNTKQIRNKGAS